jgi:hypothetical protein
MTSAAKTTIPKRQHWAPECYLEAWWEPTGARKEKPGVWVIDRGTRTVKQLPINGGFMVRIHGGLRGGCFRTVVS